MDEYVIYPNRKKLINLSALSLLFVLIGVFLILYEYDVLFFKIIFTVVGYLFAILFTIIFFYGFYRILSNKPLMILNQDGIINQSALLTNEYIRWEEIKRFFIYDFNKQKYLGIELIDPTDYYNRINQFKKNIIKKDQQLQQLKAHVNVSGNLFPIPLEELLDKMNAYFNPGDENEKL